MHYIHDFYQTADHDFGPVEAKAGVRYQIEQVPGMNVYNTSGVGNVSYNAALSDSSGLYTSASGVPGSVNPLTFYYVAPYLALSERPNPHVRIRESAGSNYGAPAFDVFPMAEMALFKGMAVNPGDLWNSVRPETETDVDLGVDIRYTHWYVSPTVYYSTYQNKDVAYEAVGMGSNQMFLNQNVGQTQGYGADVMGGLSPFKWLDLFADFSYDQQRFTQNLSTGVGSSLVAVNGNLIPDLAPWLIRWGVVYHNEHWAAAFVFHYVDGMYADAQNTMQVPGYLEGDLDVSYKHNLPYGLYVKTGADIINLWNSQYIAFVSSGYGQASSGSPGVSFFQAAPFTIVGNVTFGYR
jgi:iron complex outermembrane receptor protein